jgi:hypothetical protein
MKGELTIGWIGGVLPAFVIPDTVPIRPVHVIRAESTGMLSLMRYFTLKACYKMGTTVGAVFC